jgi:hypothetical protein
MESATPGPCAGPLTADDAAARLDAYGRACRAALVGRGETPQPPVLLLSDEQLAALFAPRQLESLVRAPLARPRECEPGGQ